MRYDRQGDQHYDVISAFIKSIRGSDADAALHYLARMIEAGEDPRFIARRLVILASEDIGLADPTALTTAVAAAQAVQLIGMPEARLNLAQADDRAGRRPEVQRRDHGDRGRERRRPRGQDRPGAAAPARRPLRRVRRSSATARRYAYSHDEPFGIAEQQYAPDVVAGRRVLPADRRSGAEAAVKERWERIRRHRPRDDRVGRYGHGRSGPSWPRRRGDWLLRGRLLGVLRRCARGVAGAPSGAARPRRGGRRCSARLERALASRRPRSADRRRARRRSS